MTTFKVVQKAPEFIYPEGHVHYTGPSFEEAANVSRPFGKTVIQEWDGEKLVATYDDEGCVI